MNEVPVPAAKQRRILHRSREEPENSMDPPKNVSTKIPVFPAPPPIPIITPKQVRPPVILPLPAQEGPKPPKTAAPPAKAPAAVPKPARAAVTPPLPAKKVVEPPAAPPAKVPAAIPKPAKAAIQPLPAKESAEPPVADSGPPVKAAAKVLAAGSPAKGSSLLKDVLFLLLKIVAILLAFMLLFTFMYGLRRGVDPTMKPAIQDGDLIIFYRLDKTYVAGDVLLLEYEGQTQVRRVAAVAGDVVDIVEDGLVINGALQQEPDIYKYTERYAEGVDFPLTVGEGQVFVLADARDGATDSRIYGAVDTGDTLGKVITVLRRRNI